MGKKIKFFQRLPEELQKELKQFELKNFYREEERTPEYLAKEKDKYFIWVKATGNQ